MNELYNQAAYNRNYDVTLKYGDFYQIITTLIEKGIYSHLLIEKYSKNEIESFAQSIDVKRDELFDYLGLYTFATRYLATDHDKKIGRASCRERVWIKDGAGGVKRKIIKGDVTERENV